MIDGEFQAIKILFVRYFSTRRFVGHGTKIRIKCRNYSFLPSKYLPFLPKERPFVVRLSDGFTLWIDVTKLKNDLDVKYKFSFTLLSI